MSLQNHRRYRGTAKGFLERQVNVTGDVEGNTLGSSVAKVGGVSSSNLIKRLKAVEDALPGKVDDTDFEEYKKTAASKCYAVAMSIALG